jgi:hypothetical protein
MYAARSMTSRQVVTVYVVLTLLSTLASSFTWGINTLFLLEVVGTVTGGLVAQATTLGAPYLLRAATLVLTFAVAFAPLSNRVCAGHRSAG